MDCNVGQYISELVARSGLSQADVAREISVSRQSLSYVICGKRDMSLQLAMKLESYFSLPDGELMKMQALQAVRQRKQEIRNHLCEVLVSKNALWSYDVSSYDAIPDEELIEKCFTQLDMDDIDLMFEHLHILALDSHTLTPYLLDALARIELKHKVDVIHI